VTARGSLPLNYDMLRHDRNAAPSDVASVDPWWVAQRFQTALKTQYRMERDQGKHNKLNI
jgi:hypothetical protein